jgi:hypothetical protein
MSEMTKRSEWSGNSHLVSHSQSVDDAEVSAGMMRGESAKKSSDVRHWTD